MTPRRMLEYRDQTRAEERANAFTHAVGLLFAIATAPVLIVAAVESGDAGKVTGAAIFCGTMILLYLSSTMYHGLRTGRAKRIFLRVDFCSIFLFIAGSYTPFTLSAMSAGWGWSIFGVVWAMAFFGVILKTIYGEGYPRLSLILYMTMGWLSLAAIYPLWSTIGFKGVSCLFAGGLAYTGGVFYFINDSRAPYNHTRWHIFVVLGTVFHWLGIWAYVI